jgi:hypothetical protein
MRMDSREGTLGGDEYARAVERRGVVEEKLRHDVREMLEVLRADVPSFFVREAKRRFVASPELAERFTDAQVAKIKKDVQAAGDQAALELTRALEPASAWAWDARAPLPERHDTLDAHPRVSAALARIGGALAEVLAKSGFPDAESARDSYKLPSYFVAGRFMKSLVESYWRNLQEQVELARLIDESQNRERRERSSLKWDKS